MIYFQIIKWRHVIPYAGEEGWHNLVPAFQRIVLTKIARVALQQLHVLGRRLLAIPANRILVTGHYGQSGLAFFCSSCRQMKIGVSVGSFLTNERVMKDRGRRVSRTLNLSQIWTSTFITVN